MSELPNWCNFTPPTPNIKNTKQTAKHLQEDVNVIAVDWEKGADTKDYNQAAANTRVVGALIAQLVVSLRKYAGVQPKHVHLIGHSLGAHVAGYAGEKLKGIGRITGK